MKMSLMLVALVGVLAAGQAQAALVNPSFEDTPGPGVSPFAGWSEIGITGNVFREPAPVLDGSFSAKMFSQFTSSDNYTFLYQDLPALPGQQWTATISVQHTSGDALAGGNDARMKVEFLDAGHVGLSQIEQIILDASSPTDVWTEHSLSSVAPAGTAFARMVILFHGDAGNSGGAAFFDLASFSVPEPATIIPAIFAAAGGLVALGWRRRTARFRVQP